MGSKRIIVFEAGDKEFDFNFGNYAQLMYYAKQVDTEKARKLFEATFTKYDNWINTYWYESNKDRSKNPYDIDDDTAHFESDELKEVILFIETEVMPLLENEKLDIMEQYGGASGFVALYYTNPGYLEFLGFSEDEYFEGNGPQLAFILGRFSKFLKYCIETNQPYKVYID